MSVYKRENEYIKLLSEKNRSVKELSKLMYISEPTVRRDLYEMKNKDLVTCNRGIVSLRTDSTDKRIPFFIRDFVNNDKKEIIAEKAVDFVKDGDIIMLDASTTVYCLIPKLSKFKNILCITNGAKTALCLASYGIKTICTGGELDRESFCYFGVDAENTLVKYMADVAFFSCRGIDEKGIATDSSIYENNIRRIMIKNSNKSYLLCDSSKRGKRYLSILCDKNDVDGIITDKNER